MSEERDIIERRPARLGGFAPGGYFCKCVHCDEQFTGDKRAISCLPCAISFSEAEIQRLRGEVERLRGAVSPAFIRWLQGEADDASEYVGAFRQEGGGTPPAFLAPFRGSEYVRERHRNG